ncbi:MAG: ABC transporter substrate-binding protein [Acidobacteriota bacterium]
MAWPPIWSWRRLRLALALPLLALAARCAGPTPPAPDPSETLRIAIRADPRTLDPLVGHTNLSRMVSQRIFEPLIDLDAGLQPVPRLALEWQREENGAGWRFRLRPGVRWHDGRTLVAADLAATLERALDPRTPSLDLKALLEGAGPVEALGALEVRVPFSAPAPRSFLPWKRLAVLPAGGGPDPDAFARAPVGTGPYRLSAWRPGEWILLERNPHWWGGKPAIRFVLFHIIPDALTVARALNRGDLDIAYVHQADYQRSLRADSSFRVVRYEAADIYVVVWNLEANSGAFSDPRVRRALALAFNRQAFATQIRRGLARVAATLYPPLWRRGRPGVAPLPYDPREAARLLEEAGWIDADGDGWRERAGQRLGFPLLYALEDPIRADAAQVLQADLARVGVEVRLERVDAVSLVRRLRSHDFVAAVHAWALDPLPQTYDFLHSSQRAGGFNYGGYTDPALDHLLELEVGAGTESELLRAGAQIETYLREQAPLLFICFPVYLIGVSHRVEGFSIGPLGLLQGARGPEAWSLRVAPSRRAPGAGAPAIVSSAGAAARDGRAR